MAITLRDIPAAIQDYLNTKVGVTVGAIVPAVGAVLGPNEQFSYNVEVRNTIPLGGGIALKNVRYHLTITNPAVAKLKVPAGGAATDLVGAPLAAGTEVSGFIFRPAVDSELPAGDIDTFVFEGKAGSAPAGGNSVIKAKILADIDMDQLFPKGEDSATASRTLTVVG